MDVADTTNYFAFVNTEVNFCRRYIFRQKNKHKQFKQITADIFYSDAGCVIKKKEDPEDPEGSKKCCLNLAKEVRHLFTICKL